LAGASGETRIKPARNTLKNTLKNVLRAARGERPLWGVPELRGMAMRQS
jgi:hypothetical protein